MSYLKAKALQVVASRAKKEVILKVVNVSSEEQDTEIIFQGVQMHSKATALVLKSDRPEDENSLAEPEKVAPFLRNIKCAGGATMRHNFPANSVTVMRLKCK